MTSDGTEQGHTAQGNPAQVRTAEVVLPCTDLDATLTFFVARLGFRVDVIFPADDPAVAVISGHGVRIRLQRGANAPPGVLRLACDTPSAFDATELTAPNGTRIDLVEADPPPVLPPLQRSFVLSTTHGDTPWKLGRAGMRYRDLIPDRQGGRFIASLIEIPAGGVVPDYVHLHDVRLQVIYCYRGWVRVVYEDQGPPFVLHAGDCVLQPPQIRHRVLECSPWLAVIEIGCPAEHATRADHAMALPTPSVAPQRSFAGQRFVRHEAAKAQWLPWRIPGFAARDTGIAAATGGLAAVRVARKTGVAPVHVMSHDAELLFTFVLAGGATLHCEGHGAQPLAAGDAFVVPAGLGFALAECSDDTELLEVALPATFALVKEQGTVDSLREGRDRR